MPATPNDIAAASRDAALATWTDAAIEARYPSSRDGSLSPAEGFFDSVADAQVTADTRGVLIGRERRRFAVAVDDVIGFDPAAGLPQVRLVDAEHAVDADFFAGRIEVDLDAETTSFELFG